MLRHWGVTGTNGKTTTVWILADFISAAPGRKCGYITTVEAWDGRDRYYTGYTTPPLAKLKEIYAAMEANGCTDCAMEVSSHAIHQNRVGFGETTTFCGGAFTNLSRDHLDYHKTMEEYFRVKADFPRRIADGVKPVPSDGRGDFPPFAIAMDGGFAREMCEIAGSLTLNVIPVNPSKPRFDVSNLKLPGDFNRSNVLLAAALAEASGVAHGVIQSRIPLLEPRWGRMEEVESRSRARIFVDFAHTPDGLEKVLSAARPLAGNRLWVVFGAGGDRDASKRPLMGRAAAGLADVCIVTSDNPRSEDPMAIIRQILSGMGDKARDALVEPDRRKAIEYAVANSEEGDVVLVCGKGHETTQEIAGVKHPFDDREAIRACR